MTLQCTDCCKFSCPNGDCAECVFMPPGPCVARVVWQYEGRECARNFTSWAEYDAFTEALARASIYPCHTSSLDQLHYSRKDRVL